MMDAVLRRVRPDQVRELTLVVVLVLMITFFALQIPGYLSPRTFTNITTGTSIIATVAVGQVLVLLTRNVDLSVGAIVGLVAYVMGTALSGAGDVNPIIVVAGCMALGASLGAINGAIVAYGRVPAIITTQKQLPCPYPLCSLNTWSVARNVLRCCSTLPSRARLPVRPRVRV